MSVLLFLNKGPRGEVIFCLDEGVDPMCSPLSHLFQNSTWTSPPTQLRDYWEQYTSLIIGTNEAVEENASLPRPREFYNSNLLKSAIQKVRIACKSLVSVKISYFRESGEQERKQY
jgi:hypothetical protein